jgi:hypothetical protein
MHLHTLRTNICEAIATKTRIEMQPKTEHIIINAYLENGKVKPIAEFTNISIRFIEILTTAEPKTDNICKNCLGNKLPEEPICKKCKTKLKKRFKNA